MNFSFGPFLWFGLLGRLLILENTENLEILEFPPANRPPLATGKKKEPKPKLFGPVGWGWDGISRDFAGISQSRKRAKYGSGAYGFKHRTQ